MSQAPSPQQATRSLTTTPHPATTFAPPSRPPARDTAAASLPSPDTLDIVPTLHELLNRVLTPVPGAENPAGEAPRAFPGQEPLDISKLKDEASGVRAKIRKAKRDVAALPDVDRTVKEQELEIDALRVKIAKQTELLRSLSGS